MEEQFKTFFEALNTHKTEDSRVYYVMSTLQDMAEAGKFEEFQYILDNADVKTFNDSSAYTVALVSWCIRIER